ncbi:hypothetical protein ACT3UQ_05220 [Glutamicibacter sp. AOP12-B1-11]|uniref:hypothetical protein n=1 Tax=Glutamicibacter sp. AOP12-B1-11 TaxID=3457725 RepID=UPI0040348F87
MILADEITCEIADPNAAKIDLINCSTSLIDSAKGLELMWIAVGAIGAFGAMLITIFMARYAWKAWKSSQEQVQIAKDQMKQSQKIAIESQRIPSTAEFTRALYTVARHLNFWDVTKEDFDTASRELGASSDKWQLLYGDVFRDGMLFDLIANIQYALSAYAERWWRIPIPENSWPRDQRSDEILMLSNTTSILADTCGELLHGGVTEQEYISLVKRLSDDFSNDLKGMGIP